MGKKGFTLIELMVVIAIIGLLAVMVTNFDFNKKTDVEKRDRFVTKIESMMQSDKIAMLSGKGVRVGADIINPTSIRLVFSSGAIITNYYSGTDIIWVGDSLTSPFYGESGYNLGNFYYINKDSSTGAISNPFSVIYDSNGNISFSGSDSGIDTAVMFGMNVGYHATKYNVQFDRRFGKFLAEKTLIETGSTSSINAPVCTTGTTWDGTNCVNIYIATQTATCGGSIPANAISSTTNTYIQTWDNSGWTPVLSWTNGASTCGFACNANYTWNGTSCTANTQTFTCTAKPATGTVWNSVSNYTQTWNGSAWTPTNSTTTYNTTASTTSCNYKCDTTNGYNWNGSICVSHWTQTFTSSSTWIVPGGVTQASVTIVGGGGGGGGARCDGHQYIYNGGGGGGGEVKSTIISTIPGGTLTINIGNGGGGGGGGPYDGCGGNGGNGGSSSIYYGGTPLVLASPGNGGKSDCAGGGGGSGYAIGNTASTNSGGRGGNGGSNSRASGGGGAPQSYHGGGSSDAWASGAGGGGAGWNPGGSANTCSSGAGSAGGAVLTW